MKKVAKKAVPAKREIANKISDRGLLQGDSLKNDARVAKIGSTPRKWSKKAK